jgi:multicomponent Na+:H+ antiporter subunit D
MTEWAHPAGPFLVGAIAVGLAPGEARRVLVVAVPVVGLVLAGALPGAGEATGVVMGQPVSVRVDALGRVFALIFALFGGLSALYGLAVARPRLHAAAFVATGSAIGIALAGDWLTFYLFWEILALASFVLVAEGGTPRATRAALGYLLVHVTGGALLLTGLVWHRAAGGSGLVGPLPASGPGLLVLTAFAVNAAMPPLHAWLTDAYPESSPAGSVVLSAFATKSAVYALARVFAGVDGLVWAGVGMALYGVVFAVLENNIRRLLAYHIVSQVGYMVAGVGLGTSLAISGAAAHAFCHILYKGLLFMGAGAVVHATGRGRLTDLGGLGPRMPMTFALYMVGALSITGAPLLNGFVSKSLVVAAAEAQHRWLVAALLMLASVGTFLSVGLKLPALTFGGADRGLRPAALPAPMVLAMVLTAGLCLALGIAPGLLYRLMPFPVEWSPYTPDHVVGALQLLAGTALGFLLLRARLAGTRTVTVDADRIYRAVGRWIADEAAGAAAWAADRLEAAVVGLADRSPGRARAAASGPIGYPLLLAVAALGLALALLAR